MARNTDSWWNAKKVVEPAGQIHLQVAPAIRMIDRNGPPEGLQCPFFMCAVCGEPVYQEDSENGDGMIVWLQEVADTYPQKQCGPFALHKGWCDHAFEVYTDDVLGEGWIRLWNELGEFIDHLVHNARASSYDSRAEYVAPLPSRWHRGMEKKLCLKTMRFRCTGMSCRGGIGLGRVPERFRGAVLIPGQRRG